MGILSNLHIADTVEQKSNFTAGRPWQQIVFQPTYLVALFGAITGYGIMILGMTATPIAMRHSHMNLGQLRQSFSYMCLVCFCLHSLLET